MRRYCDLMSFHGIFLIDRTYLSGEGGGGGVVDERCVMLGWVYSPALRANKFEVVSFPEKSFTLQVFT